MKKLLFVLLGTALLAAACGDDTTSTTTTTTTVASDADSESMMDEESTTTTAADGDKPEIVLVTNPWTASYLNVSVASQLIESELGYPTDVINIDENEAMYIGLADGELDAVLEIWPSGITETEQAFFDDGGVTNIGELGTVGKIGWFVPDYVVEENPELATWEGYSSSAAADLFATTETGDNGRFLGTDPSYSQFDEQIINNLGLPFEVIFSGTEAATVAELDARVSANEPILLYWWTPTAAVSQYNLVNVPLPEIDADCEASIKNEDGGVDCDYPEDVLFKAASAGLEQKAPDVWSFLQKFTITTEDQLSMLPPVELDGEDVDAVAAQWIADNESRWSAWLS